MNKQTNYLADCQTIPELKSRYRFLIQKNHPDVCPHYYATWLTQDINTEYQWRLDYMKRHGRSPAPPVLRQRRHTPPRRSVQPCSDYGWMYQRSLQDDYYDGRLENGIYDSYLIRMHMHWSTRNRVAEYYAAYFAIGNHIRKRVLSMSPRALWKLKQTLEALGEVVSGNYDLRPESLFERKCLVDLRDNKIKRVMPYG